ncbi:MAG: amidohydrolase family protein, partial [Eubacteriales bacterium]|nr:amidohydrolase family protein [Eubacteriales bacterium]
MAFGFFKKNEMADAIFMGGNIYTQNSELPWAEAVACKDGLILAVGDYEDLTELEGKHTEIIDLEGKVMLPGYIDTCGHPVMRSFRDSCLHLIEGGLTDTLAQISEYAAAKGDADIIFAYGYDERILLELEAEQARAMLDSICEDKPVVVLGKSGFHCFVNTTAMTLVRAAAEEDEIPAVTLAYILGILEPIDLSTVPEAIPELMEKYCERGFTSVFDCGAPDFFASLYQNIMVHLYQENLIKQRFFGSLLVNRSVNPKAVMHKLSQFRTNCAELNGYVNLQTLKLVVEGTGETLSISGEALRVLCTESGDKGFDVHIDALGEAAVSEAVEAIGATRAAGYKKSAFTLAHVPVSAPEDLTDTCYQLGIAESSVTLCASGDEWRCIENAKTVA